MEKKTSDQLRVTSTRILPHGDNIGEVLTKASYQFPHCVAELVDNSIDADSRNVLIRFVRIGSKLQEVWIIDDGDGIAEKNFDLAMQFAGNNSHHVGDTGMYGVGLKTGSLAMAKILNVVSKTKGSVANGRRWSWEGVRARKLDVLDVESCNQFFEFVGRSLPWKTEGRGTIVQWQDVKAFGAIAHSADRTQEYLDAEIRQLEQHLGLVFHRFIDREQGPLTITIEIFDLETADVFLRRVVKSIDPFRYPKSGARGYPKQFTLEFPGNKKLIATAHIWPKGMKSSDFKIPKKKTASATDRQGLYIYRSDRLLMAGGWDEIVSMEAHQSLARVAIEITGSEGVGLEATYDKTGVQFPSTFPAALLESEASDGTTFPKYLDRAREINRTSGERQVEINLAIPQTGVPTNVTRVFDEVTTSGQNFSIVWQNLRGKMVFKIDRKRARLIVNTAYKDVFYTGGGTGTKSGSLTLTLLTLALNDIMGKQRRTATTKAIEDAIQSILVTAIDEQI